MLPSVDHSIMFDSAIFSDDRVYRYQLTRMTGWQRTTCLFIMLNPSTADETKNDPTVARCISFAKHWGFGRLEVCNIFAYRATEPRELRGLTEAQAVGPDNDRHIASAVARAGRVVCAWGNHGELHRRGVQVRNAIILAGKIPLAFKITGAGQPIHPLYQKKDAPLITWAAYYGRG